MVINILDHISYCHSHNDGEVIASLITPHLKRGEQITLSFSGVYSVPSSFVNSAFIRLLDEFTFEYIRGHLMFVHSTKQINEMIKKRFDFEVNKRPKVGFCYA